MQLQTLSVWLVPAVVSVEPVGQGVHMVHAEALVVVLNWPGGQPMQPLSVVAFPAADRNCPAVQVVCGLHMAALFVVLNSMAGLQAAQTRSAFAVPAVMTNWPGTQTVYGRHTLSLIAVPDVFR